MYAYCTSLHYIVFCILCSAHFSLIAFLFFTFCCGYSSSPVWYLVFLYGTTPYIILFCIVTHNKQLHSNHDHKTPTDEYLDVLKLVTHGSTFVEQQILQLLWTCHALLNVEIGLSTCSTFLNGVERNRHEFYSIQQVANC